MTKTHNNPGAKLVPGIRTGLKKGWTGFIWLLKIIIPVSFATGLLVYFGLIYKLDFLLTPLMNWLGLPASAALVIIAGIFTGIYGTVAALSVMPFSMDHMILLAIHLYPYLPQPDPGEPGTGKIRDQSVFCRRLPPGGRVCGDFLLCKTHGCHT